MKHEFITEKNQNPAGLLWKICKTIMMDSTKHHYIRFIRCGVLYCDIHGEYVIGPKGRMKQYPCKKLDKEKDIG